MLMVLQESPPEPCDRDPVPRSDCVNDTGRQRNARRPGDELRGDQRCLDLDRRGVASTAARAYPNQS